MMSAASDETVTEGQTVTLHCQTTAVPPVAVVWRHNTRPVHENHRTRVTGMSSSSGSSSGSGSGSRSRSRNRSRSSSCNQMTAVPPVAVVWRHNTRPVHENHCTRVTGMSCSSSSGGSGSNQMMAVPPVAVVWRRHSP